MKHLKILFALLLLVAACYSTDKSVKGTGADRTPAVKTAGVSTEEVVNLYGLVKVENDSVYIVTNWRSKSMVTYRVTGSRKPELLTAGGRYVSVSGVLTEKKRWSGTIDVSYINSVDEMPDPTKGSVFKPFKGRDAK